jgi:rhodanese-related sulfurtransferase
VAASFLRHQGLSDTSDLSGGFAAWQTLHLPTVV